MAASELANELWVDKYRPKTLDGYVINDELRSYFKDMISKRNLQNLTLAGCQGAGKTTLARILANEFNAEVLFVKCATDGTLDVLRTKITEFCNACSIEGRVKIVILDELDSASATGGTNSFQMGLRTVIEAAQDDTRFICTANFSTKILPAILSRCPQIPLKFDKKDLLIHVKKILDLEKIKYDKESLKTFIEEAFRFYPDCRRIINYLQFCCNSGSLVVKLNQIANSDKDGFLKELVTKTTTESNLLNVRSWYIHNKEKIDDYVTFASDLFNYVVDNGILVDANGILRFTDMIFQLNQVVDKEPTFFGLITLINKFGKK